MMRVLRWILVVLAALVLALAALVFVARWLDGPLGPIPGGPLRGELAQEDPGDWSFAGNASTLELEVGGRSLTVWYVTEGGTLYVAAAEAARKRWPAEVVAEGRVRLRIGGRLYERRAVRITDPALAAPVGEAFAAKYKVELDEETAARSWLFRIDPLG
jgi:uncharacterized protein DUF2255